MRQRHRHVYTEVSTRVEQLRPAVDRVHKVWRRDKLLKPVSKVFIAEMFNVSLLVDTVNELATQ